MLKIIDLSFDYPNLPLLGNINFSLEKGKLLHLKGKNGSGKTTLLRILAGIIEPTEGKIFFKNRNINQDLTLYQKELCYVGHKSGLHPLLTVKESCYFDSHWRDLDLLTLLKNFNLESVADKPCYQLSAGQLHRLGLLRLAMTEAALWLLDEPLVALDEESVEIITKCFNKHLKKGGQIVLTSHQSLPEKLKTAEIFNL